MEVLMRRFCLLFVLLLFCLSVVKAQFNNSAKNNGSTPAVDIPITVKDGTSSQELRFGLDPSATNGLDPALGENELPPLPPTGTFDARFIDDPNSANPILGQGVLNCYFKGTAKYIGTKVYFINCQVGSGTTYQINWNLQTGVTGILNDIVTGALINKTMTGKDSLSISKNITTLKMTINYALDSPALYIISPSNSNPAAGTNITINAQLADVAGSPIDIAGKTVTWSKTGTGGSFSSPTSTTNTIGIASVTFTVSQAAGTVYTVTGTDNSAPTNLTGTSGNIIVISGAANKYLVTSSNAFPTVGTNVTITAQLTDQYGNTIGTSSKTVSWSKTGTGGSFSSPTSLTNSSGVANVTFTVSQIAGTVQTVTGTDNNLLSGTTGNITSQTGPPARYLVTSSRYNPIAGDTVKITAQLVDQYGNVVGQRGNRVSWSKTGAGGNFNSQTSTTNASGAASVIFTLDQTAGIVYTVTGIDNNLLSGTTGIITTQLGTASKYIATSSRYNPIAGDTVKITAQLTDQNGNAIGTSGKTLTWSKTGTGGSFSSPTSTTNANGVANVIFTVSQTAGTVHTITGTDNNLLNGTTGNITTQSGIASKYIVLSSRYNPVAGDTVKITAQLTDQNGNSIGTSGKTITWKKTGIGGNFSSPTSTTNASGVANVVFTVSQTAGIVYTVTATDNTTPANLTGTSGNITAKAGDASKYLVTSSSDNPTVGTNVTITAQLTDQYGNSIGTSEKTVTWTKTGTGGSFSSPTSTTNVNGIATVTFTVSQTASTIHTVTATDNTLLTGTSEDIVTEAIVGINELVDIPTHYELNQNYPNPFNPTTTINYSIPKSSFVTIKIYDVLGKEAVTLVNENKPVGNYRVHFNAGKFVSGVYFYRMQAGDFVQTKKIILLK